MIEDAPLGQPEPGPKKSVRGSFLASWLRVGEKSRPEKKPFSGQTWNLFDNFFGRTVKFSETLATAPEAAQDFELLDSEPEDITPSEGGELFIRHQDEPPQPSREFMSNRSVEVPHNGSASEKPTPNPFKEYEAQIQHEQRPQGSPEARPENASVAAPQEVPADTHTELEFETRHEIKDHADSRSAAAYSARASADAAYRAAVEQPPEPAPVSPPPMAEPPLTATEPSTFYRPAANNRQLYIQAMRRGFWAGILLMAIWWLIYIAR